MLVARPTTQHLFPVRTMMKDQRGPRDEHHCGLHHHGFTHHELMMQEADRRPRSKSAMTTSNTTSSQCICQEEELERAKWRELNELLEHYINSGRMTGPWREHWTHTYAPPLLPTGVTERCLADAHTQVDCGR
jgi:hypothetical protein